MQHWNGDLEARLRDLEEEERTLSRRRRVLHERIALYPDATGDLERREQELSAQRRDLHARIDALRASLSTARAEETRPDAG